MASEPPSLQEVAEMTPCVTFLFLLSQGSTHWHTDPALRVVGEPLQTQSALKSQRLSFCIIKPSVSVHTQADQHQCRPRGLLLFPTLTQSSLYKKIP